MKFKKSVFFNKLNINKKFTVLNNSLLIEQIYVPIGTNFYKNKELLTYLKAKKFLVEQKRDDVKLIKDIFQKNDDKEFNILRVLLTDLCNLNCKYCKVCYNIKNPINTPTPLKDLKKVVKDLFKQNKRRKVIHITGGEPLLFYQRVKELIEHIRKNYSVKEYDYIIIVGTNGLLLDEEKINFFKKNKIKIIISLDGRKKSNKMRVTKIGIESFSDTIRAIKRVDKAGIEYGISMVVGKHNIGEFDKDIDFVLNEFQPSSIGVNFIKNTKLSAKSSYLIGGEDYAKVVYKIHKKYRDKGVFFELLARKLFPFVRQEQRLNDCGASNGTAINIDARGNIGICKSFLCLFDQFDKMEIDRIINKAKHRSPIFNDYCRRCFALGICGNGCIYEGFISDKKNFMDKRACKYMNYFYKDFLVDLFELNKDKAIVAIKKKGFYVPSKLDRKKLLGKVKKNKMGLKQCIGHEI